MDSNTLLVRLTADNRRLPLADLIYFFYFVIMIVTYPHKLQHLINEMCRSKMKVNYYYPITESYY